MPTTVRPGFNQETFDAFWRQRDEPRWLRDDRQHAWRVFQQLDWPRRDDEQWLRTDIRPLKLERYPTPLAPAPDIELPPALLAQGVDLAGQVTAANGHVRQSWLAPKWSEQGVLFGGTSAILAAHDQIIKPWFIEHLIDPALDKFAALHAAFRAGGAVLYVPAGVVIDQPLHLFSVLGDGGSDFGHVLVVLEDDAEATLLCETAGSGPAGEGFHCGSTEVFVNRAARCRLVNLQDWGHKTWHFAHQKAVLQRDASMQWTVAALGSRLSKVNQTVELAGAGASCQVNGVLFTEGKQHIAYNTLQHHIAPHGHSDFLYKSALQDNSRTVWRGMIQVDPAAQRTDGYQRNDNLLLGSGVRADSIPGLAIEADDVRCSHGSTTGRVDDELIFYAQARGFTREEAVRMIVTGFFQQVFDRITIESVRESLSHAMAQRVREYA